MFPKGGRGLESAKRILMKGLESASRILMTGGSPYEGRDMENQNISDDLGVKSMIQFVVCKIYILHIIFCVIIYGFFFS